MKNKRKKTLSLTSARLQLNDAHLEPCVVLLVLVELPLPLLHVGRGLLEGGGQSSVVVLQGGQLDLPLLGVGGTVSRYDMLMLCHQK